jgi:hypothetical protein
MQKVILVLLIASVCFVSAQYGHGGYGGNHGGYGHGLVIKVKKLDFDC